MSRYGSSSVDVTPIEVTGTKILKFSASWCGPCKQMTQTLNGVDLGVPVEEVDVDQNSALATQFQIRGVPTLVMIREGKETGRAVGALTLSQIKDFVKSK